MGTWLLPYIKLKRLNGMYRTLLHLSFNIVRFNPLPSLPRNNKNLEEKVTTKIHFTPGHTYEKYGNEAEMKTHLKTTLLTNLV